MDNKSALLVIDLQNAYNVTGVVAECITYNIWVRRNILWIN